MQSIVIFLDGGRVDQVISKEKSNVIIVDRDVQDLGSDEIQTVLGQDAYVYAGITEADVAPETVGQVIKDVGLAKANAYPYELLTAPLTKEELIERADEDHFVTGVIAIGISNLIGTSYEVFLDSLSNALTGRSTLSQIEYEVVGHEGNTIHIEVSGDVSEIVKD